MTDFQAFSIETSVSGIETDPFEAPGAEWSNYFTGMVTRLLVAGIEVGTLRATLIRGDQIGDDRQDLHEVLDAESQEMHELCSALIDFNTNHYVEDVAVESPSREILYLEYLVIEEPFRRCGFGLAMIQQALRCPHALAVMEPFPLQHRKRLKVDPEPRRDWGALQKVPLEEAKAKLEDYYARLGFETLGETKYMIRDNAHRYASFPAKASAAKRAAMLKAAAELAAARNVASTLALEAARD